MIDTSDEEPGPANILVISEDNARAHIYPDLNGIQKGYGIGRRGEAGVPKPEYFYRTGRRLLPQFGSAGQLLDLEPASGIPDPAYVLSRLHATVVHLLETAATMPPGHPPVPMSVAALTGVTDLEQAFELYNGALGHGEGASNSGSWLHMLAAHGDLPW